MHTIRTAKAHHTTQHNLKLNRKNLAYERFAVLQLTLLAMKYSAAFE